MTRFRHESLVVSVLSGDEGGGGCAPGHPDSNVCKPASPNTNPGGTHERTAGFEAGALDQLLGELA